MKCSCCASRCLLLAVIIGGLVGCDQATKLYAVRHLKDQPSQSYLGDIVRIRYVENPGAFLGLMGELGPRFRFWALTVANGLILGWVAFFLLVNRKMSPLTFVALALIIGGGLGNLIDRVRLDGYVIDFLNIGFGDRFVWQRTGIFNIADVAITAGFLGLFPFLLLGDRSASGQGCSPDSPPATT